LLAYLAVFIALQIVPELAEYTEIVGMSVSTLFVSITTNLVISLGGNLARLEIGAK